MVHTGNKIVVNILSFFATLFFGALYQTIVAILFYTSVKPEGILAWAFVISIALIHLVITQLTIMLINHKIKYAKISLLISLLNFIITFLIFGINYILVNP